jgi:hypothetical protein
VIETGGLGFRPNPPDVLRQRFFFEKKKQKTFIRLERGFGPGEFRGFCTGPSVAGGCLIKRSPALPALGSRTQQAAALRMTN